MQDGNKRIAKNTMFLYFRMLLSMLISLYTSRIILNILGFTDYGLYNVIIGVTTLFIFLNGALGTSTSRFLTFELGRKNSEKLRQIFATTLYIHLGIALVIIFLCETFGLWFVNNKLVIPEERMHGCNILYQFVLVNVALNIIQIPMNAIIIAHEQIKIYAFTGILDTILKFCIAISLSYFAYDRLVIFGFLQMLITISIFLFYCFYCKKNSQEFSIGLKFNRNIFKEMIGYSMWNLLGSSVVILKNQGVNILINIFHGPAVNAANAIAYQVNQAITNFSGNFITALNPQIIKSYANKEVENTKTLIFRGGKFSFFLLMVIAIPIILEINTILQIWLKDVPQYSNILTQLVVILALVECFTYTIGTAIQAVGKIKYYQIAISGILLLNFPLSYIAYKQGADPSVALIISIFLSIIAVYVRLFFLKRYIGISIKEYMANVLMITFTVLLLSTVIPFLFHWLMNPGIIRLIVVSIISILSSIFFIFFIGLRKNEKKLVVLYLKKFRLTLYR